MKPYLVVAEWGGGQFVVGPGLSEVSWLRHTVTGMARLADCRLADCRNNEIGGFCVKYSVGCVEYMIH